MYDVYSCGFDGVMIRPKRVQKQKILIFAKDFACPRGARRRQPNEQRSGPVGPDRLGGSLWVSVGDFGSLDGHFAIIVESLWVYEGPFSKTTHFPYRF